MRILIVEDDEALASLLVEILEDLGHTARATHSAEDAERVLHETQFDAMIVDQILKMMPGIELISKTRKSHPDVQCILMSGHFDQVDGQNHAERLGAQFLRKPFEIEAIIEVLESKSAD